MDEQAFRQRLHAIQENRCVFSKAVLSTCVACPRSGRMQIAEREWLVCEQRESQIRCAELYDLLRHNFGFALHIIHDDAPITHGQEMRIQCGGLKGLQQVLSGADTVDDVEGLLRQVLQHWGEWENIPYSEVVHAARECYKGRHG